MIWTIPNRVAVARLLLSPLLVPVAWAGRDRLFLALFLVILATDWIDGRLAVLLDQRTEIGARLDTVADGVLYTVVLIGLYLLVGEAFVAEWPWMVTAVAAYALSWGVGLAKFGRVPSYHPWSAKLAALLTVVAVVALVASDDAAMLRIATVAVTVANLEATAITLRLDRPRPDVPGLWALGRTPERVEDGTTATRRPGDS